MSTPALLKTRLLGLGATLGLLAYVVGVPLLLIAIDAIPRPGDLAWSRLSAPDDGTVILAIIAIIAWVAWAVFTVSVVLAIAFCVRGLRAPRLPGLAVPQLAADRIVGAAMLLFVALPSAAAVVTGPRPAAAAPAAVTPTLDHAALYHAPAPATPTAGVRVASPAPATKPEKPAVATEAYTVKRGDSLWKIAETRLGDGARYTELVDLNQAVLDGEPDFLIPGTVLRVPVARDAAASDSYLVEPGDTLSDIAEDELGDAQAYSRIFEASKDIVQPDGARLTDPDRIRPGWTLTIPAGDTARRPPQARTVEPTPAVPSTAPIPVPTGPAPAPENATPGNEGPVKEGPIEEAPDAAANAPAEVDRAPDWLMPGLAGAGALLAGSVFLVVRQHRRAQQRYRRPGRMITPPPGELRAVAKSTQFTGSVTALRMEVLDHALRDLAATVTPIPRLVTAALTADELELTLAEPADLAAPWSGSVTSWTRPLRGEAEEDSEEHGREAPYPLLVSIGSAPDGAWLLVNLEELRSVTLTGDRDRALALGRHLAAELAVNPWSTLVEVDTLGLGAELITIDPMRHHHHGMDDASFLDRLARDLEDENPAIAPDHFRALIADVGSSNAEAIHNVAKVVTGYAGRPAACVVTVDAAPATIDTALRLGADGRLTCPDLGLELVAAGLSSAEAQACAALVEISRDLDDAAMPTRAANDGAPDQAGTLAPALTAPRPEGPAGAGSLLPLAAEAYEQSGATTKEDLDALAPVATEDTAEHASLRDPKLDADLAAWESPTVTRPRLTLLGPVTARTRGGTDKIAHRPSYYVELLAYLHLHPDGVTAHDIASAFGIEPERARNDVSALRSWLGTDPHTGALHLPKARQTHETGIAATYAVHGVLCDSDLFCRLRTRGQARGAAGIDDLVAALRLVNGAPFSRLRAKGWNWLVDAGSINHAMTAAIADMAHIVITHALATDDVDLASFAVEKGATAAPYDEVIRLDLIAVGHALGYHDDADQDLVEKVLNRRDDDFGPLDTPPRTAQIIRQRGWDRPARKAN